jgi:hypothetical protein
MGPRPLGDELEGRDGGRTRNFGGALMPGEVGGKRREGGREGGKYLQGRKGYLCICFYSPLSFSLPPSSSSLG